MKTSKALILLPALLAAIIFFQIFSGCKPGKKEIIKPDPGFIPYISGFSTGILSSVSTIRVRLAEPSVSFAGENQPAAENLFEFNPPMKGETFWMNRQTVEFRPSLPMEQDKVYEAAFYLGKVCQVEPKFDKFRFGFRIMQQAFEVIPEGLIIEDPEKPDEYTLEGTLNTADAAVEETVKEVLKAAFNGKNMDISWIADQESRRFSFRIAGISRNPTEGKIELSWNGKPIGVESEGDTAVSVPSTGIFIKTGEKFSADDENIFTIYFSDPLDPGQDLRGIVTTSQYNFISYRIHSNMLKVIFNEDFEGEFTMKVSGSLLNSSGKSLGKGFGIINPPVYVSSRKPQVKATGKGCILPTSQGLIFPFDAVALKSVRLTIIKIFENNIAQFLQENELSGTYSMRRVGRPVFSKVIPLTNTGVTDFSKWNRFTFDLSEFIKVDPGSIYQVHITFGRNNISYPCAGIENDLESFTEDEYMNKLLDDWSQPGGGYYADSDFGEEYYDYDWSQRDNPCNSAYYQYYETKEKRMIHRNILATDIALILKRGTSGDVVVAVTDIRTAAPMADVDLEALDYQLQKLYRGKSDKDGFARFRIDTKPFLLIAKKGSQRSYLRINDASALSISNFDVSGEEVQKGLKGFIYGERGVWRPGDSLFITFVLQDKQDVLPSGHPIVFELKNPSGMLTTRLIKSNDKSGMFTFRTCTPPEAPTGKWTAMVKAGGSLFSKTLRLETVKPNRLKVNFRLNNDIPFGATGKIEADLHAQWLHGGKAGNLKATYEVLLAKAKATFKSYGNFTFDDPGVSITSEYMPVFSGTLDSEGNAEVRCDLKLEKKLPSAMNAYFRGKVFEPGGDFSVDFLTHPILPYDSYAGMRVEMPKKGRWLETGTDHTVYLATVDKSGNPLSIENLKVEIYRMRWSWWWQEDGDGDAQYIESSYNQPIKTYSASTTNGKGSFTFRIDHPDWGRFLIRVTNPKNGQSCAQYVYIDWPYSYGRSDSNIPGGATMLGLSSDKSLCKVGEAVKVTIPGMPGARALVSVENGSKVLDAYWIDAGKSENVEEISTTPQMSPNVFIYVTVIQPHKDKKNDIPIRQYGIVSLDVEDPSTILTPVIKMPEQLKPGEQFSVTVSEKSGKQMMYTVAIVDEGLLDLTHFKTPDPHDALFAREALGVKTFDLFDDIIGAYGGRLERLLSIGGDQVLKQEEKGKNLRFKPVVLFLGPFSLKAGGKSTHHVVMPNYIGSVRAMVVAASYEACGFAEKPVPVRQDVMVMATLPRVIRPGEEFNMPVNLFVMNKSVKSVTVNITSNKFLDIRGTASRTVTLNGEEDKVIYFRLKAGENLGMGKVDVVATGGSIKATCSVDLPVIHASQMVSRTEDYQVPSGRTMPIALKTFGFPGTNSITLELSQVGRINFSARIRGLINYPYGCAEQTTSSGFAQLSLSKVVQLDAEDIKRTENNIRESISRLTRFQTPGGGFLYWPGAMDPDDWVTSYIGNFLVEARKAGYSIPDQMLMNWKEYQRGAARRWTNDGKGKASQLVQAYRLYTLALSGSPAFSEMNWLKEIPDLVPQASWRLALAYALAGKKEIALGMVAALSVQFADFRDDNITYGSNLRDRAMALEALTVLGLENRAMPLAKEIADVINSREWLSTQDCAWSLLAMAEYYRKFATPNPVIAVIVMNGKDIPVNIDKFSVSRSFPVNSSQKNSLSVKNKSGSALMVSLTETGIPMKDDEVSFRNGLTMSVSFEDKEGRSIDITKLKQGTEFRAVVSIGSTDILNGCKDLALRQIFASGWEITNMRIQETAADEGKNEKDYNYRDIRDDRVYTFFDLIRDRKKNFVTELTATYAGRFFLPGTFCEAMYTKGIGAKDTGMWVEVVP